MQRVSMQQLARGKRKQYKRQSTELSRAISGPRWDSVNVAFAKNLGTTRKNGKVSWELVQPARHQIGRVLALASGKLEDSARSFVEPFGAFQLNPKHLTTRPANDSSELANTYFYNVVNRAEIHSQNQLPGQVSENMDQVRQRMRNIEPEYISSLALVPNKQYNSKYDFDSSSPFIAMSHRGRVQSFGKDPLPVLGVFATEGDINSLRTKYDEHKFYGEYATDAVVAMAAVSDNLRATDPPVKPHLQDPQIGKSRPKAATKCYTSHALITVYEGNVKVDYNLREHKDSQNPEYGMYYKGIGNVLAISASMVIRTVTVKALGGAHDEYNQSIAESEYLAKGRIKSEPENVIAQEISYSATYYTKSWMYRGDVDVKVVSVCAGDPGQRHQQGTNDLRNLAMVMLEFGNGVPLQHNIANTDDFQNNLFCHRLAIPAEVAFASIGKAVQKAVRKDTEPIVRGWRNIITAPANIKSLQFNVLKNQMPYDSRLSENDAFALSLQHVSACSREMGLLMYGSNDANAELPMCIRTELAHIFCPVGRPIAAEFRPWAPIWDTKTEADFQTAPGLQTFHEPAVFNDAFSMHSAVSCDLDLDEIMNLAAKPSAFDNEVYM
jgi:hypothetical protein